MQQVHAAMVAEQGTASSTMSILFEPFTLKGLPLANRIVMAPMTRLFSPGGVPGEDVAAYYERRARHGVGLIVTEGTTINRPVPAYDVAVPRFHGEDALAGWQSVFDRVHQAGGRIAPQIWHAGAARHPCTNEQLPGVIDSPSGIFRPYVADDPTEPPATEEQIADVVAAFARACEDAVALGCDAIELHGAHGYLFDQFFWAATNRRVDGYGGKTLPERARFAREVIEAVRAAVPADLPLILRVSQWKSEDYAAKLVNSPQEMEAWLQPLVDAGVDCFHCSQRRIWEPEFEGSSLNLAGWVKKVTGVPTIAVGSVGLTGEFLSSLSNNEVSQVGSLDGVIAQMERGEFDLVAVGRALLHDPEWAEKVRDNRTSELLPYDPESMNTLY